MFKWYVRSSGCIYCYVPVTSNRWLSFLCYLYDLKLFWWQSNILFYWLCFFTERPLPKLDSNIIDLYKGYITLFSFFFPSSCMLCDMMNVWCFRVGKLLSRYTNGKIPKAFKHIPAIELWEDVLYLTEPENWSPNAMFQATKIFSSNLSVKKAQRFYTLVLLPRVREDIRKNKRLHFALYQALKKSLYKPAAFFKGVLLPLCQVHLWLNTYDMIYTIRFALVSTYRATDFLKLN